MWDHPPSSRSKLVGVIGIYVLLLGALYTYLAYAYALWSATIEQTDILSVAFAFSPAAVLSALGIGLILHNRWAFVSYLLLTAMVVVWGIAELAEILIRKMPAAEFHFIVIRAIGLVITVGAPASMLWTRRDCFRAKARDGELANPFSRKTA